MVAPLKKISGPFAQMRARDREILSKKLKTAILLNYRDPAEIKKHPDRL